MRDPSLGGGVEAAADVVVGVVVVVGVEATERALAIEPVVIVAVVVVMVEEEVLERRTGIVRVPRRSPATTDNGIPRDVDVVDDVAVIKWGHWGFGWMG